jgi:EF hand
MDLRVSKQGADMNTSIKVLVLASLLVGAAAVAQETPKTASPDAASDNAWPDFATLDKNGDGSITKEEAKTQSLLASRFQEVDRDGDGKLSAAEYDGARKHMTAPNP